MQGTKAFTSDERSTTLNKGYAMIDYSDISPEKQRKVIARIRAETEERLKDHKAEQIILWQIAEIQTKIEQRLEEVESRKCIMTRILKSLKMRFG